MWVPPSPVDEQGHFKGEPLHEKINKDVWGGGTSYFCCLLCVPSELPVQNKHLPPAQGSWFLSGWGSSWGSSTVASFALMRKKMKKKRNWLVNGRWVKKRTCRRVNTAPTTAMLCQAPEGAKQLQAKPSQVLMKRLLEIFFFLIHFRTCHLGYEAETEGNLLGFF